MILPRFRHVSPKPISYPSFGGDPPTTPRLRSLAGIWNSISRTKPDEEQNRTGNLIISQWLSAALARRNIHYGWVMVGVTFLTAVITAGTVGAPGVFIVPLQKEFGWSTAEISSAL